LHFRLDSTLDAHASGVEDTLCGIATHALNARIVNARVNIDPKVVIARTRIDIEEAAPVIDDPVSERELRHSLLKLYVCVVVKRPGRIAARRELGEESVPENAPFPLAYFALGHESPIKVLDHLQGEKMDVRVKSLHANSAIYAQPPKIGFNDKCPAVGIFAGHYFEASVSSNDGVPRRFEWNGVFERVFSRRNRRDGGTFGRFR
jgi:hypothetical protein